MGTRGYKVRDQKIVEEKRTKRKRDNESHTNLCRLVAKDIKRGALGWSVPKCSYVTVELATASTEQTDVFGWNYWTSVLIEVKMSRSDFLADFKKPFRANPEEGVGEFRYYCCPTGVIKVEDVPDKWGLLYEYQGVVRMVKEAERLSSNVSTERAIISSIARREGVKPQIFDYKIRKTI